MKLKWMQLKWSRWESPRLSQRTHKTKSPQCQDPLNRSVKSLSLKQLLPAKQPSSYRKIKRCLNPFRTSRRQPRRTRTPFSSCLKKTALLKREANWPLSAQQHLVHARAEPLLSKAVWWVSSRSEWDEMSWADLKQNLWRTPSFYF